MKKLLVSLIVTSLLVFGAFGCPGGTTTKKMDDKKTDDKKTDDKKTDNKKTDDKKTDDKKTDDKKTDMKKDPTVSLKMDTATIGEKDDEVIATITVNTTNEPGDVTLELDAPKELSLDNKKVVVKKGEKDAKVKVMVDKATAREKDADYKVKVTATGDKGGKDTGDMTVTVKKKAK